MTTSSSAGRMTTYNDLPLMLGVPDLAALWGCSERVASEWCADNSWDQGTGKKVAVKIGRAWRVPKYALPGLIPAGSPEVAELRAENVRLRERAAALEGVLAAIETAAVSAKDTAP